MDKERDREGRKLPKKLRIFGWEVTKQFVARVIASIAAFFTVPWLLLYLPWAKDRWTWIVFGALGVFALAAIILLIIYFARRIQKGLFGYKALAQSCGIEGFHPLTTADEKNAGWGVCVDRMAEARHGELCLAVFTGASTFACESRQGEENRRSPLRDALDRHKRDLRILLMQKGCEAWEQCIKEFGKGDETEEQKFRVELEAGHKKARKFCEGLAQKPVFQLRSIEVREYDRPPLWKMVLMGNYLWLQYYVPGERSDDRPAYVIRCDVPGGMAYPLQSVFEYRWKMSEKRVLLHRDRYNRRMGAQAESGSVTPPL